MKTIEVHTVVLGSGPGGYVAAIRLAQLDVDTLLVERDNWGGVCLNVGCIPSKALIHAAKTYQTTSNLDELGITTKAVKIDFARTQAWKQKIVGQLTGGVKTLVTRNGAKLMQGHGRFRDSHHLEVTNGEGETQLVAFRHCIIATGSVPITLPQFPIGDRILDSTGALALGQVPGHMVIIGGGYIGLELGFVYRKLGAEVVIVEMMDSVLPGFDPDVIKAMSRKLKKEKFTVMTGAKASGFEPTKQGLKLTVEQGKKKTEIETEYVFVSIGRKPNSSTCAIEQAGVELDERGFIKVDRHMRTNIGHIHAIGDVTGQPMLAHHASYQGEIAAEVIAGHTASDHAKTCAAVVFTDPEIATVGMSEEDAKGKGVDTVTGTFPFAALGKAKAQADTEGFVKIIAAKESEEILGVVVMGHNAGDLIGEALLGIEMGAFLDDIGHSIHPHPTLTEALMEAAKKAKGQAIHVLN